MKKILFNNKFLHQTKQTFLSDEYKKMNHLLFWLKSQKKFFKILVRKCTKRKVMLCEIWLYNFNNSFVSTCFFNGSFKSLVLERISKKYSVKFSHCSNNRTVTNFNDNHLVLQSFFAYFPTTSVIWNAKYVSAKDYWELT